MGSLQQRWSAEGLSIGAQSVIGGVLLIVQQHMSGSQKKQHQIPQTMKLQISCSLLAPGVCTLMTALLTFHRMRRLFHIHGALP